jgi:predicted ATPase/DNA-binding winged helix-turn-helix (wHTH) protein
VIYRFGAFALDTERYELRQDGEPVDAEPKVLEVLAYLVARRDRVVAKEELVEEVWKGQFVSDSAVSRAIRQVRRALGDTAADSRWVKTVYGRGFAFARQVVESAGEPSESAGEGRPDRAADSELERLPVPSPLTSLVGRERELREVCELLAAARLLTLTGAGGAGKTRLALEVAHRCAGRFADGAAFAALADIAEPELTITAIARALGTGDAVGGSAEEAVRRHIADRQLLLVLDNFERVVDARGVVADLLRECPNLVVLVTSRFVLQVEGEQEYSVPPLTLPETGAPEEALREAASVALFLERARAGRHDFRPQGADLAYVAEICRRLDGLPLAIELAAARAKVLAPRDLWQRLAERSDLLSAPLETRPRRHRSLELALGWSYDLLAEEERRLLDRLTIFAGGCTLAAVERVCSVAGANVVDTLTALVDKSLVHRLPDVAGRIRFGLLETTRSFVRAKLGDAQEEELRDAHARWVLDLARRAERHLGGGDQESWLERLDAEHDNLMAALKRARTGGDLAAGLATAAAVARYWSARGTYRGGREELEGLLSHAEAATVEPSTRADALMALGLLSLLMCEYPAAERTLEEARVILGSLDDPRRLAETLNHLSWVIAQGRELDRADSLAREALALHRQLGDARGIGVALNNLGCAAMYRGDAARAEEYYAEALVARRAAEDSRGAAYALANLAVLRLLLTDRFDDLRDSLEEARSVVDRLGDRPLEAWVLCAQGGLAARRGATDDAVTLLEESLAIGRDAPHPDGRAWTLLFLGLALGEGGDRREARRRLEQARQIWQDLGVPWGVAQATWRLAEIAREDGRSQAARELFEQSVELFESLGARANVRACQRVWAEASH